MQDHTKESMRSQHAVRKMRQTKVNRPTRGRRRGQ